MILETFPVGLLSCNCTLLGDEEGGNAIVVDPGDDIPGILTRLARHRLTLKQIVITHAHIDHVGGAARLRQATGAPVLLNQNDLPLLEMIAAQAAWLGVETPETAPPDEHAADGMIIGLLRHPGTVIYTPGHTEGSICLHFAAEKLLLAGDTLFAGAIGRTDLPGGNLSKILSSIQERLMPLPDDTLVIPGHGGRTSIGHERESNPYLI